MNLTFFQVQTSRKVLHSQVKFLGTREPK